MKLVKVCFTLRCNEVSRVSAGIRFAFVPLSNGLLLSSLKGARSLRIHK
jgi:hypothetical protein